jgi:hypothetical protein
MTLREYFPASIWIWRTLTGRIARRIYFAIILLLLALSTVVRIRTFLLTRKIEAVIAGLSKLQIDETTEDEVVRTVPYLIRSDSDREIDRNVEAGEVDKGVERVYYARISNEQGWMKFSYLAQRFSRIDFTRDGHPQGWIFAAASVLGYRFTGFSVIVVLLDGKVSSISYEIVDRLVFPRSAASIISVRSTHAYWAMRHRGFEVSSTDDESPRFRVGGNDGNLRVSFSPDASPELRAHIFQVKLSCFWNLFACQGARQIAPQLWEIKNAIVGATVARLESNEPCPDRILDGRVRYLPDMGVVLLESTGGKNENADKDELTGAEIQAKYKLIEVLRGGRLDWWNFVRSAATVPYPGDYHRKLPNMGLRSTNAGERLLVFTNFSFDSCQIVPATPSALSAVKNATVARRRSEDIAMTGPM